MNASRIQELQTIIDTADPFLVEAMIGKSIEELIKQLQQLRRELDVIPQENQSWRQRHLQIIDTVNAILECKLINEDLGEGKGIVIG